MFFSKEAIIKAYRRLGNLTDQTGKKSIEVTSALRYLIATSALLKRHSLKEVALSPSHAHFRNEFIKEVGEVVAIKDNTYTNNFLNEFLTNSDYAVRNNFLTTRLKTNSDYPGRPAPVLQIVDESVKIHVNAETNLLRHYHNFKLSIVPLCIWLLRHSQFEAEIDALNIVATINEKISKLYESELANVLVIKEDEFRLFQDQNSLTFENIFQIDKYDFSDFVSIVSLEVKNSTPIKAGENIIFYGAPGTGKSFRIQELIGDVPEEFKERVTFHPEYDHSSFIGGYRPVSEGDIVKYKFVPQIFTDIYIKSWKDLDRVYYLIIEEINRGNCAEIFGILFQLLDRKANYSITPPKDLKEYLEKALSGNDGIKDGKMCLPPNLHIYATMNTSDQSLFPMDSAFKRRWAWEYMPICYEERTEDGRINDSYYYKVMFTDGAFFEWVHFIKAVNLIIRSNPNLGLDKCLGNYFIQATDSVISINEFINKVLFYLWMDVFKDEEISIFQNGLSYEDFFPIATNGKNNLILLLNSLSLDLIKPNVDNEDII
jgi:hypothetical protein